MERLTAGELDREITIETPTKGRHSTHKNPILTWNPFAESVRAKRMPEGGREFFQASQVNAEMTDLWKIRYRPGLSTEMRLVEAGQVYEIVGIDDESLGRKIGILVSTKAKAT
jgi:SPP1 family predicted phage head-tail adaptor